MPRLADRATLVLPDDREEHTRVFRGEGQPLVVTSCDAAALAPDENDAMARAMAERRIVQVARESSGPGGGGPPAAALPLMIGQRVLGALWIDPVREAASATRSSAWRPSRRCMTCSSTNTFTFDRSTSGTTGDRM